MHMTTKRLLRRHDRASKHRRNRLGQLDSMQSYCGSRHHLNRRTRNADDMMTRTRSWIDGNRSFHRHESRFTTYITLEIAAGIHERKLQLQTLRTEETSGQPLAFPVRCYCSSSRVADTHAQHEILIVRRPPSPRKRSSLHFRSLSRSSQQIEPLSLRL